MSNSVKLIRLHLVDTCGLYRRRFSTVDVVRKISAIQNNAANYDKNTESIGNDNLIMTLPNHAQFRSLNFFVETYGCQMNVSDSEIVQTVLLGAGHTRCDSVDDADLILVNTCAIRENAEAKIWHRLKYFQSIRNKNKRSKTKSAGYPLVGVLGCMAERLKTSLLEEQCVKFVCGPDAYRDIPRLVELASTTDQKAANVQLSLEETYADIAPVRESSSKSAFVSIMRGCNNMCSYCIVPFTRGRERSRPLHSIVEEIKLLAQQGIKEIVLLGQNVNSYHDTSEASCVAYPVMNYITSKGFTNLYKSRDGPGARFADLLELVSEAAPETRIRFTSPHPKDFPDQVLQLIASHPNICSALHLPAQSGSTTVLERMRRGYTRAAYDELIDRARTVIPNLAISSDFITGFCGETEAEHRDTISLMQRVRYDQAYMFAYSLREKTHAARAMSDDVPAEVKQRRLQEVVDTFYSTIKTKNESEEVGQLHLVLVEGTARSSAHVENNVLSGRTDTNKRCLFSGNVPIVPNSSFAAHTIDNNLQNIVTNGNYSFPANNISSVIEAGDYVVVKITEARGHTLRGIPIAKSSISEFSSSMKC